MFRACLPRFGSLSRHVASLHGNAVGPEVLGMSKVIGDESLRRALAQIAPAPKESDDETAQKQQQTQLPLSDKWMDRSLLESVEKATVQPKHCPD